MKAVISNRIGELSIEEIDVPQPEAGEVRVKIVASGLCHTDLSVIDGNFDVPRPLVLGHEGVGHIDALGSGVDGLDVGDPVVCSITMPCYECHQCRRGALSLCDRWYATAFSGTMPNGTRRLSRGGERLANFFCQSSFAEYAVVPAVAAVRVPEGAPLEKIAGLACGISTGLGATMVREPVKPGSTVAVLGAGGVGVAAMFGAASQGADKVIAIDRVQDKLDRALEIGAATDAVLADEDVLAKILALTPQRSGLDAFYDAAGVPGTIELGVDAIRRGGTVVAIGISKNDMKYQVPIRALIDEKIVTGTNGGSIDPHRDIPRFVEMMMSGKLPIDRIADRTYGLDSADAAVDDLRHHRMTRGTFVLR
jgi:Zn-dependent alcohol dehydrogenase